MFANQVEENLAIFVCFRFPDPPDAQQGGAIEWLLARHIKQGSIMKDHIRRDRFGPRQRRALRAQALEQCRIRLQVRTHVRL